MEKTKNEIKSGLKAFETKTYKNFDDDYKSESTYLYSKSDNGNSKKLRLSIFPIDIRRIFEIVECQKKLNGSYESFVIDVTLSGDSLYLDDNDLKNFSQLLNSMVKDI